MLYCILCNSIETIEKTFCSFFPQHKSPNSQISNPHTSSGSLSTFSFFFHEFFIKIQQRVKERLEHKLEQTYIVNCSIACNSLLECRFLQDHTVHVSLECCVNSAFYKSNKRSSFIEELPPECEIYHGKQSDFLAPDGQVQYKFKVLYGCDLWALLSVRFPVGIRSNLYIKEPEYVSALFAHSKRFLN